MITHLRGFASELNVAAEGVTIKKPIVPHRLNPPMIEGR